MRFKLFYYVLGEMVRIEVGFWLESGAGYWERNLYLYLKLQIGMKKKRVSV